MIGWWITIAAQSTAKLGARAKALRSFFPVTMLGGHREYQKLSTGDGRACPGAYGMILVDMLRREYKLGEPKK